MPDTVVFWIICVISKVFGVGLLHLGVALEIFRRGCLLLHRSITLGIGRAHIYEKRPRKILLCLINNNILCIFTNKQHG